MAKTVTIEGGIYLDTAAYSPEYRFKFFGGGLEAFSTYMPVVAHTVTATLPDNWDPRAEQIKALEAQRLDITAKFQAAVTDINARISKLTAIANGVEPETVDADDGFPF